MAFGIVYLKYFTHGVMLEIKYHVLGTGSVSVLRLKIS